MSKSHGPKRSFGRLSVFIKLLGISLENNMKHGPLLVYKAFKVVLSRLIRVVCFLVTLKYLYLRTFLRVE